MGNAKTDSSSAKSIAKQDGTSRKIRHIQLCYFALKIEFQSGIIRTTKKVGETNPSDVFTQFPRADMLKRYMFNALVILLQFFNNIFNIK